MKKLKRLAALLLAGAMVMLLFTACGGSSGEDTAAEEAVMKQINLKRGTSTQSLENDKELRDLAMKYLNEDIVNANISLGNHKFIGDVHIDGVDPAEEYVTVTVTANYMFNGTLLNSLLDKILGSNRVPTGINVTESGNWTKVGVVVKSDNSQKYVAVSVQVKNLNYKK